MKKILMFLIFVIIIMGSVHAGDLTDSDCGGTLTESSVLTEDMTCSGTGLYIPNNDVVLDCDGHSITYAEGGSGMGVNVTDGENVTIKHCDFIESSGNDNYGVYLNYPSGASAPLGGDLGYSVRLESNSFTTIGTNSYDVGLVNAHYALFYNQSVGKYEITHSKFKISDGIPGSWFNTSGLLMFNATITATGSNLDNDIIISNNKIQINSSKTEFNQSATLVFYGPDDYGGEPDSYRNKAECPDGICSAVDWQSYGSEACKSLNQNIFKVNVTSLLTNQVGYTNYSLSSTADNCPYNPEQPIPGGVLVSCGDILNSSLIPTWSPLLSSNYFQVNNSLSCNDYALDIDGLRNSVVSFEDHSYGFGVAGASDVYGIKIKGISENYGLTLQNFKVMDPTSGGSLEYGVTFKEDFGDFPTDVELNNFTIQLEDSDGIVITSGSDIWIRDGELDVGSGTSLVIEDSSDNITLENLQINASKIDLNITNSQVTLINQTLLNYSLTNANVTVINNYGKIKFNELITESSDSFNQEIQISNNYAYVNSPRVNGLNVSAEITLYDVNLGMGEPVIFKDGVVCTDCGAIIQNGNNYTFTVTGFSSYTINSSMCGWYVNESSILNESLNCSGTGLYINASNIVLDCNGSNITYGNLGADNKYGVYTFRKNNITIKNCNFIEGNTSGNYKHGVYFSGLINSVNIANNTFELGGYYSDAIRLESSFNLSVSNNTIHTTGENSGAIYIQADNGEPWISGNLYDNIINLTDDGSYAFEIDTNVINVTIQNNEILEAGVAFVFSGGDTGTQETNFIINNTINNIKDKDLLLGGTISSHVRLINQIIELYSWSSYLIFENLDYGMVEFDNEISPYAEGDLSKDIVMGEKRIYVNGSKPGLNQSAELSFYNTGLSGNVRATRQGVLCGSYCSNISQNGDNYSFNVTGFSRYGVTSSAFCDEVIDWNLNQRQNLECSGTGLHVGADNIVIDCQGYNITYGNNSFGYGINNSGYNNVTIKNCNLIEGSGTGNSKHAINFYNSNSSTLLNNTITTTSTGYGINIYGGNSNNVQNNTVTTNEDDCYGIRVDYSDSLNVKGNIVSTLGDSFESSAIKISNVDSSSGSNITGNIVNTDGQNAYGIHLYLDADFYVGENDIETSNSDGINIYLEHSDNNEIINNSVKVTNGASAIYVYGNSDNNLIENNTIEQARVGIEFEGGIGDYPDNNTIKNNDLQTITQRDLVVWSDITNLWLVNQSIGRYYIESSDVNFMNDYGIIDFTEQVSGTDEDLDLDVVLNQNDIGTYVSGFNKKANLTIYNITILGTAEAKRNDETCEEYCGDLTAFNCNGNICDYSFNVTGFSNYSVGEMGVDCGDTINNTLFMVYSLPSCSGSGIFIGADNIIIDCQDNNITYGDGNAINNSGYSNVTLRNCNLIETGSTSNSDAIYFKDADNSLIENIDILTINSNSDGIYFTGSSDIEVSNLTINSSGFGFNFYDADSITIENNSLINNQTIKLVDSNNIFITDQDVLEYSFNNSIFHFENDYGKIEFLEGLTGNGTNLSEDLTIEENLVYVNSTLGEDVSATIRLYNLSFNGTINTLRNGIDCGGYCSEVLANGEEEYYFNVTGFSNYSLTGVGVSCNQTIYNTLFLNESLSCNQSGINIGNDNVVIDCQGYDITYGDVNKSYGIDLNGFDNVIIRNCELVEGSLGGHAVYVDGSSEEIYNNTIKVSNENSSGLYLNLSDSNTIWNNTLNSSDTGSYVIYIFNSSYNELENNSIVDGGRGIKIYYSENNTLHNNSINNVDNDGLNITGSNYTTLFSQDAEVYELKGIIYFETAYGKITYNEELNQTGINLSSDINITNNSIAVAEKDGLNKSASLEFYDVGLSGLMVPYRNGEWCSGLICSNFGNTGDDYYFNVTGFSNYNVTSLSDDCGFNLNGNIILGQDLPCGKGVNINANSIVLDCNGYSIYYGNLTDIDDAGVFNDGFDDVTVKNCVFEKITNPSPSAKAIVVNNTNNCGLENNQYSDLTRTNLYIDNSTSLLMKDCGASNYVFINSTLVFENDYGKIEYNENITAEGDNISEEVYIEDNLIHVDGSSDLNKGADLSFYDLSIQGTAYAIRNDASCGSYCSGFSSSGNNYYFTVSGFSNYSVGDNTSSSDSGDDTVTGDTSTSGSSGGLMGDFYAPVIGSPFPVGQVYILMPSLSIVTDEVATCRWDFTDKDYGRMDNNFEYLGQIHVWNAVEDWEYGDYTIYARCRDGSGNINGDSYSWTFSIVNESQCGNGICEDDETAENCPADCGGLIDYIESGNEEEDINSSEDLSGKAYSIFDLLENLDVGSWLVYLLVLVVLIGGYAVSHKASSWLTGVGRDNKNVIDDIKPELVLSAKKIKYRLMNEDVYNATLEYLHMKELFNKIPKKYKTERRYLYGYMINVYNKIQGKVDELNKKNKHN